MSTRWPHLLAASGLLVNLLLLASWSLWRGTELRSQADRVYMRLCHRQPERCYVVAAAPLPVCARCVGVWVGAFLGALAGTLYPTLSARRQLRTALVLLGALLGSWLLGATLLPVAWHAERTVAGVLGGIGLYLLVWWGISQTLRRALLWGAKLGVRKWTR